MRVIRRDLLAGSLAIFGALVLGGCGRSGEPVLHVGSQKGGTKALMLASGALEGAGYRVEWSEFPAAQNLLEALGSGAVDLGLIGDAPFQFAYQSGSSVRAVAAMNAPGHEPGALAIVVGPHSPLHGVHDLVGRTIATTHGSIGHYLVLRALAVNGIALRSVRLTFLSPSDSRAALQTGAVDAWSAWAPYTVAVLAGGGRILVDGRSYSQGTGFDVASAKAIAGRRDLLADFLAREARAMAWAQSNSARFAAVLAKETGLPPAIALATVRVGNRVRVPLDPALIASQQVIVDTFRQSGEIKAARPVAGAFVPIT